MSANTAHTSRGVLIHAGEQILLHCKNISVEFPGQSNQLFLGSKHGYVYLTSHRLIFRSKRKIEFLQSLSLPFVAIDNISVDSNSINGKLRAQPNGNFEEQIDFKIFFKSIEIAVKFGDALLSAISLTNIGNDINCDLLPPYYSPRVWFEGPWGTYKCPTVFKKWLPSENLFPEPSPNSIFLSDNHPPFPGIDTCSSSRPYGQFSNFQMTV
ncbi:postacrosomal sheath WW domain-binding protein-like [Eupeodes corollae]|uniref:postacrosomal sheath WW domain-binding protein-like n=1 Tax=Eupeodes corollae TaxID=290404 RepID=UPI00248F75F5|nr:postacrosomal sheath WW domain-binding protein-like [Eupeodes corollae]